MKKTLTILFIALLTLTFASAIDMKRSHQFSIAESKTYDFVGDEYTIELRGVNSAGSGAAEIRVNGREMKATGDVPAVFEDMKATVEDTGYNTATLSFYWNKITEEPDADFYINRNVKEQVRAKNRVFTVVFSKYDSANRKATVEINGESVTLTELDTTTLEDGSRIQLKRIVGNNPPRLELKLWATERDPGTEEEREDKYDYKARIGEQVQKTVTVKGNVVVVNVQEIQNDGTVEIRADGQSFTVPEGETVELGSGVKIKISQVATTLPKSAEVSIKVPESLQREETHVTIDKTLGVNQKDQFEMQDRIIKVSVKSVSDNTVTLQVNDYNLSLNKGETGEAGIIQVTVKVINPNTHPPKTILQFTAPKREEETPTRTRESKTTGTTVEKKKEEKTEKKKEKTNLDEEIPEAEVPEEDKKQEEPEKEQKQESNNLGNTIKNIGKTIDDFFNWLFGK